MSHPEWEVEEPALDTSERDAMRQALYELEQTEAELAKRRKERGIDYYIPNVPQLASLRSPARIVAYVGGNRAGKSTQGAAALAAHHTRNYPKCPCHGEWFAQNKRFTGPIKSVIVATEFPIIERTIEPKLRAMLPHDWVASWKRTPQGYLRRVIGKDGGTIDILSNEMDQLAFESTDWDVAWIDEPTSQDHYVAIQRGLTDRRGYTYLTFTPLIQPWMKEGLVDQADGKFIDVIQADTYANTEDIHGNPILSAEAIQELERSMPEELRDARIHGHFLHLKGVVYREFVPSVHERVWTYQYPDPVIAVLDPHTRKPHHVIWAVVNRLDQVLIDRELVMEGTVQQLAKAILVTEQQAGYRVRKRLIDPNYGRTPNVVTGATFIEEIAKPPFPVRFTEADDAEEAGVYAVKKLLSYERQQPLSPTNTPMLFFHRERCPRTIKSIRNLQYDDWTGKTKERRDPKEDLRQKDNDGSDCVRYLCQSKPRFDRLQSPTRALADLSEAAY